MRYEPKPIPIEFKTASPVFAGNGETIQPLSFVADKKWVYMVDENLFFQQALSEQGRVLFLSWIDPIMEQMAQLNEEMEKLDRFDERRRPLKTKQRNLEARLSIQNFVQEKMPTLDAVQIIKTRGCVAYQVQTQTNLDHNGFRACCKDVENRPYLPGTEIKGALRTAWLFALLEDENNYRLLAQAIQDLKPIANNYKKIEKRLPEVIDTIEARLLRGRENDAKYDLLRLLRVSDSDPFDPGWLRLEHSKSAGTRKFTDTVLETLQLPDEQSGQFRLEVVADQPELLNKLGFKQSISLAALMEACYKHAAAILETEAAYFDRQGERELTHRADALAQKNTPQTPLLRLGGGQGLLSITADLWLATRDPEVYEIFRQAVSTMRKWKNTVPGNFPKTRRAIWRNGRPADLLGWLQLFPPEAARSHAPANFKFESAAISVTPKTVAPVKQGRQTGRVQQFNTTKGYGFIKPDSGGEDVFVHVSDVDGPPLQKGEKVSFMVQRGGKGWQAKDVRRG